MRRLLDLYCGAGGAAAGYYNAGFTNIVGVDNEPQPNYPFEFIQADALKYAERHGYKFDVIHASPPCQAYTTLSSRSDNTHPDLVQATRELIQNKIYIIENVPGAPLINPIRLCGSSFGLRIRRHRLFESNVHMPEPPCQHRWQNDDKIYWVWNHGRMVKTGICYVFGDGTKKGERHWNEAMGIDWMARKEIVQAVPPAYTEYIGTQIMTAHPAL